MHHHRDRPVHGIWEDGQARVVETKQKLSRGVESYFTLFIFLLLRSHLISFLYLFFFSSFFCFLHRLISFEVRLFFGEWPFTCPSTFDGVVSKR